MPSIFRCEGGENVSKLIIKDTSTGRSHVFNDDKAGYAAAQDKLNQLRDAGHRTDLSANNTGKRLQDVEDAEHGGILSGFFSWL